MSNYERPAGHAFISYVREDSAKADMLQDLLEVAGVRVWRDTADLWPGEDWRIKVRQAITGNALVFLACFSRNSLARETTYQNEELALAIEQMRLRIPGDPWLIPVRFDDCDIPDINIGGDRSLGSIQRADLFGDRFAEGAERLVQAVERILQHHGRPALNDSADSTSKINHHTGTRSDESIAGLLDRESFTSSIRPVRYHERALELPDAAHINAHRALRGKRRAKTLAAWAAGAIALVAALTGAYVASASHGPVPGSHGPVPGSHGSSTTIARVYSGASYGFNAPNRIAADSNHVWITNPPGNSVTELNASNGSLVRILTGASYGFDGPVGIADDGTHVWVANTSGNSVTELNAADGSLVRILTGASYGFDGPVGIADDGTHVWVANTSGNSVTELSASNGSLVRMLTGASYSFSRPYAIANDGTHVWVANTNGNSVTELNASDGSLVHTLTGASYDFSYPAGIAVDGTHVWVTNVTGNSVTELSASDGSPVGILTGASYDFSGPRGIVLDGAHVWVANDTGNSVTELNASDGSWVMTMNGPSYGFYGPWGMAADGTHVWVTNSGGNSVTELTA